MIAAKGKKLVELDLGKNAVAAEGLGGLEDLAGVVLGPTGNLRAPSARVGTTWLIGFSEDAYSRVLG